MKHFLKAMTLLSLVVVLLTSVGCSLFSYHLVWDNGSRTAAQASSTREWEVKSEYHAYYLCQAWVMVENGLGMPPDEVQEWGIIPDSGFTAEDLGSLNDREGFWPAYKREFFANKPGGSGTVYARFGPNQEDVATARIVVYPCRDLPVGTNWDVDADGTIDIKSESIWAMRFLFGARTENVYTMPDDLAAVPLDTQAPEATNTSYTPNSDRLTIVFNTSSGQVYAAVIIQVNLLPSLIWRKLRDAA